MRRISRECIKVAKFTDTITIRVKAGNGGPGSVSFYREKYIPKGGPDGGDGGKGGDVYLEADYNFYNLSHLFKDRAYKAENGQYGMGKNRHGRDGNDLVINVPPGTGVFDEDGDLVADLLENGSRFMICAGGIGGKGNAYFKSSINQTPRYAQPGIPGEDKHITLNLRLIADVGLVGLPNAGKSTLLAKLTNAKPKIADYPFTTLIPNLGVVDRGDNTSYKIADIPGIIEGAHKGLGLGLSFLQHIERVKVIIYMIDASGEDVPYTFELLKAELQQYNPVLLTKPYYILLTKADLVGDDDIKSKAALLKKEPVLPVSALSDVNISELQSVINRLLEKSGAA